jgi:hypothetical protein
VEINSATNVKTQLAHLFIPVSTHLTTECRVSGQTPTRIEREVDGGVNSVTTSLDDANALSPFFRFPYLGRTNAIERFLERKQLVTWSADVDTNDWWRGSSPGAIVKRTMRRLNAKGRGIILMHDIHRRTAMALPILLKELKTNGYNVVHVVAGGERPKSIPELMSLPATDEKVPPTELTKVPSSDHDLATRQSRGIKKRRVSKQYPAHWWFQADQVTTTKRPFWVFSGH